MRRNFWLTICLVTSLGLLIIPNIGYADYKVITCEVIKVGFNTTTGNVEIYLKPLSKTKHKLFYVSVDTDAEKNRVLSIALTAISMGYYVEADIEWNSPGEILSMLLKK